MDIYQLKVFSSVYRNRGFSRASEDLHITQPSVSTHIKKLEEELGVRLFDRTGRTTVPTAEGELLFQRAEEIIRRLQEIKTDLAGTAPVTGPLTIGATHIPGSYILPSCCAAFREVHPDVTFQITIGDSAQLTRRLLEHELPLVIIDEMKDLKSTACLYRIEDELALVTAPTRLVEDRITPFRLLSLPFLIREEDSEARRSMEKQHLLHRITVKALNVVATLGSTEAVVEAVKSGLGVSILSRYVVADALRAGTLKKVAIKGVRMRRQFFVLARQKRSLPSHYRAFLDFLLKQTAGPTRDA